MAVIDASFQIEGSLLCLSEVSNMTLSGSLTSNDSSLSSLVCILAKIFHRWQSKIIFINEI